MKNLKIYIIIGIIFVIIVGSVSHFVFDWSGNNRYVGFFFPVNESIWEHMKLFYFPMSLYALFMDFQIKKKYPCVTSALLCGILLGTTLIPVLFYTYTGIIGRNFTVADISVFVISTILAFLFVYKLTAYGVSAKHSPVASAIGNLSTASRKISSHICLLQILVILVGIGFILFTYHPPKIGLFAVPTL